MKSILNGYHVIVDKINKIVGWIIAILLIIMTIFIFWQVLARFVIGNSLSFSEELARFCMIWLTMLGASYAYRKGALVSVDILTDLPGKIISKVLGLLLPVISIVFAYFLVNYGFDLVERVSSQTAPSTRISMSVPILSIPIAGILIILNAIAFLIEEIFGREDSV